PALFRRGPPRRKTWLPSFIRGTRSWFALSLARRDWVKMHDHLAGVCQMQCCADPGERVTHVVHLVLRESKSAGGIHCDLQMCVLVVNLDGFSVYLLHGSMSRKRLDDVCRAGDINDDRVLLRSKVRRDHRGMNCGRFQLQLAVNLRYRVAE